MRAARSLLLAAALSAGCAATPADGPAVAGGGVFGRLEEWRDDAADWAHKHALHPLAAQALLVLLAVAGVAAVGFGSLRGPK